MAHDEVRVFVSYCHDDIDRPALKLLLVSLRARMKDKVKFIIDRDVEYGMNFNTFMSLLRDVDGVLIFLTPKYSEKIRSRAGGVYKEFSIIMDRAEQGSKRDENFDFMLIPILFSGTSTTSVPPELKSHKYANLTQFRAVQGKRGRWRIASDSKSICKKQIDSIAGQLVATALMNTNRFENTFDEYFTDLFGDLRSGWRSKKYNNEQQFRDLFVKTGVYHRVKNQSACFIIGRKGSGKTTLADIFAADHRNKYAACIEIDANSFSFELAYMTFENAQIKSDLKNVMSRQVTFDFAWSLFFYLVVLDALIFSVRTNEWQKRLLEPGRELIGKILNNKTKVPPKKRVSGYFLFACANVVEFVKMIIDEARPDDRFFASDIDMAFNRGELFVSAVGKPVTDLIEEIGPSLVGKILITLDGFDSVFEEFRRNSASLGSSSSNNTSRAEFEIDWLRALLTVALRIRDGSPDYQGLSRMIDFCMTIPKDRFLEVRSSERDGFQYNDRYCHLMWSGIELSILIRKRLEKLGGYSSKKNDRRRLTPRERLEDIWSARFRHIPREIIFSMNGTEYRIPTYIYILRHTLWRPREVLFFTAKIIAMGEEARRRRQALQVESIRAAIKASTAELIDTEFIGELATTVYNIKDIVGRFRESKQILTGAELSNLLNKSDFRFAIDGLRAEEIRSLGNKIEYLYDIGFLGIRATDDMVSRYGLLCKDAFFFNEGRDILKAFERYGLQQIEFIVHPLFVEYLGLDTRGNSLIFDLSWSYLAQNEAVMASQPQRWF